MLRVITLSLFAFSALAQRPALEGLDPVLLAEGKEEPGQAAITAQHGRFLYQFASEETRARFRKEPERFGIQLAGACARMGAPARGNPDAYHVHEGRIYIFGSQDCYKAFVAEPARYLEAAQPRPVWIPAPESRAKGREDLATMIQAIGGADKLAALRSWTETRIQKTPRGEATIVRTVRLPDTVFTETSGDGFRFGDLVTHEGAFSIFRGEGHPAPAEFVEAMRDRARRDPLSLLVAALKADVYLEAPARLALNAGGAIVRVTLDAESGRPKSIAWRGRGPQGAFGEIEAAFSEWNPHDGLWLPSKVDSTFDRRPSAPLSWTVRSWQLNPADIDKRVAPPKIAQN